MSKMRNSYDVNSDVDDVLYNFKSDYDIEKDDYELFGDHLIPFEFDDFKNRLSFAKTEEEIKDIKEEMYDFLKDYLEDEINE